MTSQQEADNILSFWQAQRAAGIKAQDRRLPSDEAFERDLEVLRQCMERK